LVTHVIVYCSLLSCLVLLLHDKKDVSVTQKQTEPIIFTEALNTEYSKQMHVQFLTFLTNIYCK